MINVHFPQLSQLEYSPRASPREQSHTTGHAIKPCKSHLSPAPDHNHPKFPKITNHLSTVLAEEAKFLEP